MRHFAVQWFVYHSHDHVLAEQLELVRHLVALFEKRPDQPLEVLGGVGLHEPHLRSGLAPLKCSGSVEWCRNRNAGTELPRSFEVRMAYFPVSLPVSLTEGAASTTPFRLLSAAVRGFLLL